MNDDQLIIQQVEFYNTLAFSEKKIRLGTKGTIITGKNHTFKSCILEGIRAGTSGGSKKDSDLVHGDEDKGKIVITLSDGTKITKTLYADKTSKVDVTGRSDAARYLAEIFGAGYINPVKFFNADTEKRMEMLLQVMPFDFDRESFGNLVGVKIKPESKPLQEIDYWYKSYYKERTEVNGALKSKKASVAEFERTLPLDDPALPSVRITELVKERTQHEDAQKGARQKADAARDARKSALQTARDEAIKKANDDYAAAIEVLTAKHNAYIANANEAYNAATGPIDAELGSLREQERNADRIIEQRKLLTKMKLEAEICQSDWEEVDKLVKQIEKVRENLLRKLPIENVDVKDGEIYINGTIWHLVNRAERVLFSNTMAEMSCGKMKLILVDDLESLDAENYAGFIEHIKNSEYQYVVSKVGTSEELVIETID